MFSRRKDKSDLLIELAPLKGYVYLVMEQISFQRMYVLIRISVLQANLVIDSGVVDQGIDPSKFRDGFNDRRLAVPAAGELRDNDCAACQYGALFPASS